jgi:hypothetical protein
MNSECCSKNGIYEKKNGGNPENDSNEEGRE